MITTEVQTENYTDENDKVCETKIRAIVYDDSVGFKKIKYVGEMISFKNGQKQRITHLKKLVKEAGGDFNGAELIEYSNPIWTKNR